MSAAWGVRPARERDLEPILAIERATSEAPHWTAGVYREAIGECGRGETGTRRLLVAVAMASDPTVLGFIVGRALRLANDEVEGEIESVAVSAGSRRCGIGHELCRELLVWMGDAGASRVDLEVRSSSAGARALYQGLGFREVGRRRGYYAEPVDDAVLMRLVLECR